MQTPHERVGVRVRLVLALPHHAQPMPVDWKQRRRVRVVECTLCSEDGSLVYSTCLERGRKTGLVPRAEHVLCSVPGRHHNRTHPAWVNADSACGLTLCALCTAQCMLCQHHVWLLLQRRSTKWHDIRHRSCRGMCMGISLPLDRDRQSQYQHRATAATPRPGTLPPPCVSMLMRSRSRLFWPE